MKLTRERHHANNLGIVETSETLLDRGYVTLQYETACAYSIPINVVVQHLRPTRLDLGAVGASKKAFQRTKKIKKTFLVFGGFKKCGTPYRH